MSKLWHLFNWRVTALFPCWDVSCIAGPVGRAEKVAEGPSHLPLGVCSAPSSLPWGMWNLFLGFIFFRSFHRQCVGKLRAVAVGITSLFFFFFESLLKWHFEIAGWHCLSFHETTRRAESKEWGGWPEVGTRTIVKMLMLQKDNSLWVQGMHAQSFVYLTVCYTTNCSPPGFSVHRIFQARLLEWVAISYSIWVQ